MASVGMKACSFIVSLTVNQKNRTGIVDGNRTVTTIDVEFTLFSAAHFMPNPKRSPRSAFLKK